MAENGKEGNPGSGRSAQIPRSRGVAPRHANVTVRALVRRGTERCHRAREVRMIRGEPAPSRDGSSAQTADDAAIAEGKAASATTWVSLISAMRRYRRFLLVVALTSLLAIVTLAPNFTRPMVLDEVEFIEAARGIQTYGVPVYYHGYSTSAGWTLIGQDNVRGLGPSTIYTTPDGFITAVEHGADFDAIANWHPELYL